MKFALYLKTLSLSFNASSVELHTSVAVRVPARACFLCGDCCINFRDGVCDDVDEWLSQQTCLADSSIHQAMQNMVAQVRSMEFVNTHTEAEALLLEANLIKHHQPHFNVLLKDDKKYPYLCITWSEAYPRIFITRRRRLRSPLDRFYGPYVDVGLLRRTLALA
jgi:hypothetical protein